MPSDQNYKQNSTSKDESDPYAFLKTLYGENEELKKKKKELEEQLKANQGTAEGTTEGSN
jgi:ABC-type transporter lipoprotein component MlaA